MENCIDKIYEIRDSMTESIEMSDKTVKSQAALVKVINDSEFKDELKEYTDGIEESNKQYEKNRVILVKRRDLLTEVIEYYEDDMNVGDVISKLLYALGVAELPNE